MFAAAGAIGSTMARPPRTTSVAASRKFTHSPAQDEESPFDDSRAGSLLRACLHAVMRRYGRSRRRGHSSPTGGGSIEQTSRPVGPSAQQPCSGTQHAGGDAAKRSTNRMPVRSNISVDNPPRSVSARGGPAHRFRLTWLPIACTWRMPVILPGCSDSGSTASDFRQLSFFVLDGTEACQDTHHPTKCAAPVPYARRDQEVPVTTSLFAARRD